jgi:hypothetical protein
VFLARTARLATLGRVLTATRTRSLNRAGTSINEPDSGIAVWGVNRSSTISRALCLRATIDRCGCGSRGCT